MENTDQHLWDQRFLDRKASTCPDRLAQYEVILGRLDTGVFILEPTRPGDPSTLEVTMVNEMGARFFGRLDSDGRQVLNDAEN